MERHKRMRRWWERLYRRHRPPAYRDPIYGQALAAVEKAVRHG